MTHNHLTERGTALMKEPTSPEELLSLHQLRRAQPQRFLEIVNEWLRQNPRNADAYFSRHFVWTDLGESRRALDDLNQVIDLAPTQGAFCARGIVHRQLGEHEAALADFQRGEAIDPQEWKDAWITLLYEADSHARLGNEARALDCCARLPDNFWTPGLDGAPAGTKAEVAEELRRIAAEAQRQRM
jgi:tetratricopeptide (TPR) repeat protein